MGSALTQMRTARRCRDELRRQLWSQESLREARRCYESRDGSLNVGLLWGIQIISVTRFGARLNRLPAASAGDMVLATG